ncbi:MAG: dicarboxylate/amino acid:cation symporter [Chlamydiales bacterium]
MKLWVKILIALVLGSITGLILGPNAEYLKPIGQAFLSLISMIIVLLILSSMTVGITSIHDPQKLGRIGLKTLTLYMCTTVIAIAIGITFAYLFQPGVGMNLQTAEPIAVKDAPGLKDIFLSIIPSNPIHSMANGEVLQVIVFAIFLGIAINFSGEKGKPLLKMLESLAEVMYRLTAIVMEFSPIGVFALMAWVAGNFGLSAFLPLLKFLLLYYFACLIHVGLVFCGILKLMSRVNVLPFFRGMGDAMMMAFSTCSSSATLPVSLHCTIQNLGVSKNIASFMLPLGSTINMNGAALYQGMSAVFIAQTYGIELGWQATIVLVATATLSSVGAAGIPGTGFIMLTVVFSSAGIPIEGLALLAGIDRVREMVSTVLNVLGDSVCAVYIAKKEGELDERRYNHKDIIVYKEA